MARRPSKHTRKPRPLRLAGSASSAEKSDGRWVTRPVRPESATKAYTCPECHQEIPAGTAHIVAWPHTPPIGSSSGLEYRRHYHNHCWARRH